MCYFTTSEMICVLTVLYKQGKKKSSVTCFILQCFAVNPEIPKYEIIFFCNRFKCCWCPAGVIQKQVEWIFLDIQSSLTTATTESMIHVQSNLKQLTGINQVFFSKLLVMKWFQLAQELCEKLQRDYPFSLSPLKTNSCKNTLFGINCLSMYYVGNV